MSVRSLNLTTESLRLAQNEVSQLKLAPGRIQLVPWAQNLQIQRLFKANCRAALTRLPGCQAATHTTWSLCRCHTSFSQHQEQNTLAAHESPLTLHVCTYSTVLHAASREFQKAIAVINVRYEEITWLTRRPQAITPPIWENEVRRLQRPREKKRDTCHGPGNTALRGCESSFDRPWRVHRANNIMSTHQSMIFDACSERNLPLVWCTKPSGPLVTPLFTQTPFSSWLPRDCSITPTLIIFKRNMRLVWMYSTRVRT